MTIDRRRLMTGALASGAFLSMSGLSLPLTAAPATRSLPALLLPAQAVAGEALIRGAHAALDSQPGSRLPLLHLSEPFPGATPAAGRLLRSLRGRDCIAVLPAATAMLFLQLARDSGMRLRWMGTHSGSTSAAWQRHEIAIHSPVTGPAEALAAQFAASGEDYLISEQRLHPLADGPQGMPLPLSGLWAYQASNDRGQQLYCAGLSPDQAGRMAGLRAAGSWVQVPGWMPAQPHSGAASGRQAADWREALGFALVTAALGEGTGDRACRARAFVQSSGAGASHRQPDGQLMTLALAH